MSPEGSDQTSKRSLSAIMFTDIAGYTVMMGKDEEAAMKMLRKNREIQKKLIERHNGTWLKEMGDGTLSTFPTATEAINCAKEIQKELHDDTILNLRIGIHIGEVIIEDGDIYGDGVNIASRLEPMAQPGGICISESVNNSVRGKKDIETIFMEEVELKNVDKPIRVYAVKGEYLATPIPKSIQKKISWKKLLWPAIIMILLALIMYLIQLYGISRSASVEVDESTLAVFPFRVEGNESLEYLEEGMVDLVSSRLNGLYEFKTIDPHIIISSLSAEDIERMSPAKLRTEAERMGAGRFLLGNILQLGDSYRIKISLYGINTNPSETEVTIENENDLIRGIDEIVKKALSNELVSEGLDTEGLTLYATDDYDAIKLYLEGEISRRKGNYQKSMQMYSQALEIDSTMSIAWLRLWQACSWDYYNCNLSRDEILGKASEFKDNLPTKLKDYVEAVISHYYWDFEAEEKFREMIMQYGESVDVLIGLGEELYHKNAMFGRMESESIPYFLKAWQYDKNNVEMLHHLVVLLAHEKDTATLKNIFSELNMNNDRGYYFKAVEMISMSNEWDEEELETILAHPGFDFQEVFNRCMIEPYFSRLINFKTTLEEIQGEPFKETFQQPYNAILNLSSGREREAVNMLRNNPFVTYAIPLLNFEEQTDYLVEYLDTEFPQPSLDKPQLLPYEFIKAVNALQSNQYSDFNSFYQGLKSRSDINSQTKQFLLKYLDGMKLRGEDQFEASNQLLKEILPTPIYGIPSPTTGFLRGTIQTAIAENYYNMGNYEEALHWYKVRYNIINAGDEITLGYSFLRRGQICEQLQEYDNALLYYEQFLDLYKNADPKYQNWINTAEEGQERILKMNI